MAKRKDKNLVASAAFDEALFGWMAPEYLQYQRGWIWFVCLFLISGALVAYGYFTHAISVMVLFGVLPLVLIVQHRKKPKAVEVVFSPYGIKFGVIKLPYSSIKSFAILHNPPHMDELHLHTGNRLHPELIIPLMGVNPSLLRQFLVTQIPEQEGKQLSLLDVLVRLLRLN